MGRNPRSQEAWEASRKTASRRRLLILGALADTPDICDRVEQRLGMSHQTCSAEMSNMAKEGLIVKTGERRRTRAHHWADVYRPTDEACAIVKVPPPPPGGIRGQQELFGPPR